MIEIRVAVIRSILVERLLRVRVPLGDWGLKASVLRETTRVAYTGDIRGGRVITTATFTFRLLRDGFLFAGASTAAWTR